MKVILTYVGTKNKFILSSEGQKEVNIGRSTFSLITDPQVSRNHVIFI